MQDKDFLVFTWTLDETKFRMMMRSAANSTLTHAGEASILACHSRLLWGSGHTDTKTGIVNEEELVSRPVGIESNNAACMWGALTKFFPTCLINIMRGISGGVGLVALTPGSDMFSANQMIVQHISNITASGADGIFVVPGWCHQHKSGNALQPVQQILAILRPEFCLARLLRSDGFSRRFDEGIKVCLKLSVRHIKGSENPGWQPLQVDAAHANSIMELFYFRRDVRSSTDAEDPADIENGETRRRRLGKQALARFAGNWKAKEIVFHDPLDEFQSLDEVVDESYRLLLELGFHRVGTPADNKWLSVWPVNQTIGMLMSFHYIFLFALRYACRIQGNEVEDAVAFRDEDELLGALGNSSWHKRERRRQLRALSWSESTDALYAVTLFSFIAEKCIRLHYKFFKHAQQTPFGEKRSILFDMMKPDSFVKASINELWHILESDDGWAPVESLLGRFSSWTPAWRRLASDCATMLLGAAPKFDNC